MLIRVKEHDELKKLKKTEEFQILEGKVNIIPVAIKYDKHTRQFSIEYIEQLKALIQVNTT